MQQAVHALSFFQNAILWIHLEVKHVDPCRTRLASVALKTARPAFC